jgi:transcriptional regulator with XRE-family HTH domain
MARRSVRVDARALERFRKARGYGRQADLAEAAGVSAATVSRAETGATDTMSAESAQQLADALGVALAELVLAGADDPIPPDDDRIEQLAERISDKLAERIPAIMRAAFAAERAQAGPDGQPGGRLDRSALRNTDENDEARPRRRRTWRPLPVAV